MKLMNDKKFLVLLAAGAMFVARPVLAAGEVFGGGSGGAGDVASVHTGDGVLSAGSADGSQAGSVPQEALHEALRMAEERGQEAAEEIIRHVHRHTTSDVFGGAAMYKQIAKDLHDFYVYSRDSIQDPITRNVASLTGFNQGAVENAFHFVLAFSLLRRVGSYLTGDKHVPITSILYTFTRETFPFLGLEEVSDGNVEGALLKGLSKAANSFAGQLSATYEAIKAPKSNVKRLALTGGLLGVGCWRGWFTTESTCGVDFSKALEDLNPLTLPARAAEFVAGFRNSKGGSDASTN